MKPISMRAAFERITARPALVLALSAIFIVCCGAGLGQLVKDTSIKAFIPPDHPSRLADDKAREIFGLSDTVATAIMAPEGETIFSVAGLQLIADVSERMAELPNVRYDRVASLATEASISGDGEAVYVTDYIDPFELDPDSVADTRRRWLQMDAHRGTLVTDDGHGAIVMAELEDARQGSETYELLLELVDTMGADGFELHVAGPGAVSGYLSKYIDRDARKLQPLVFVLVIGFVFLAFRRARALPGPLVVIIGSAAGAIGLMAWSGIPYFAITSALPVIIVAISVADAIHILSAFYQRREQHPDASVRELVVEAMASMARPITLTTVTTIAGFAGIAIASIMPPITWFAVFAALGVFLAWLFSMLTLPNLLIMLNPGYSKAFASWKDGRSSELGRALATLGTYSPFRYRSILAVCVVIAGVAAMGATKLRIDRSQVENFAADEPIRIADELMNREFAGTAFLDVIIEADEADGLLDADRMAKIMALQAYFETLPHVQKTVSIVDYLGELHGAINNESVANGRSLPGSDEAIAQYLFLYEVSGDPTDFEEEIDADYRTAFLRGVLDAHYFSETRVVVKSLERYIADEFNEPGLRATLAGDVNVGYHWMENLRTSHFFGVALSLGLVLATSVVIFRSWLAGIIAVVPVAFTVLILYACMGYLGIYLEPATSMFAAIALGVGVDFGIHLVDRLKSALDEQNGDIARAIDVALAPVARACFFNSAALGIGFAVLMLSDLPTLQRFGGLIALATVSSFLIALIVVPALFAISYSRFTPIGATGKPVRAGGTLLLVIATLGFGANEARAGDALHIAEQVAAREEGAAGTRVIEMTLTDRRQRSETRVAVVHKERSEQLRTTRITFTEPRRSRDFSFLSHDYHDAGSTDERWMFIPVERKVRRIPASARGDSFFGTDFSFEDVQSEFKFNIDDWDFEYLGQSVVDGIVQHRIAGTSKSARIARELRYGAFQAVIDEATWMPLRIDFSDPRNRPLKTVEVHVIEKVDGIWTAQDIVSTNHQTGHTTRFVLRNINFVPDLPDDLFDAKAMTRGVDLSGLE